MFWIYVFTFIQPLLNVTWFFSWILSKLLLGLLVKEGFGPSLEFKGGYFCELLLFMTLVKKDDLAMVLWEEFHICFWYKWQIYNNNIKVILENLGHHHGNFHY